MRDDRPLCSICDGGHVVSCGPWWKCQDCRHWWAKNGRPPRKRREIPDLTCRFCGSANCKSRCAATKKKPGWAGKCNACGRNFTQGGLLDVKFFSRVLDERLKEFPYSLRDELRNAAIQQVLEGRAYIWNVPLLVTAAARNVYGDRWSMEIDSNRM